MMVAGEASSGSIQTNNDVPKTDTIENRGKERLSKKNKKKDKEKSFIEKPKLKSMMAKRLLVLPLEASILAILFLLTLCCFYVVHRVWAATEAYSGQQQQKLHCV